MIVPVWWVCFQTFITVLSWPIAGEIGILILLLFMALSLFQRTVGGVLECIDKMTFLQLSIILQNNFFPSFSSGNLKLSQIFVSWVSSTFSLCFSLVSYIFHSTMKQDDEMDLLEGWFQKSVVFKIIIFSFFTRVSAGHKIS